MTAVFGLGIGAYSIAQATMGQLTACVDKNGDSRLIIEGFTKKQTCQKGEQLISWNLNGTPGIQGPKGETGSQGPIGLTGSQGSTGKDGVNGVIGLTGPKGEKGEQGVAGQPALSLHLQDGNGQDLGIFIGGVGAFQSYIPSSGVWADFLVNNTTRTAIFVGKAQYVFFSGTGCSGTPYFDSAALGVGNLGMVRIPSSRFFKWAQTPTLFSVVVKSSAYGGETPSVCGDHLSTLASADEATEVTAPFTEPLAWPLKIVQE